MIIWVVKHAREEHKAAIEWLNNHTDDKIGFFLCEIKLYRIGTSEPAIKFEVIEKPNDWTKGVRKNESANETQQRRYDYWVAFLDYAFKNVEFAKEFKRRKPSTDHWMDYSIGSSECYISVSQIRNRGEINVALYIPDSKHLYRTLLEQKEDVERTVGISLSWYELPERKDILAQEMEIIKVVSDKDTEIRSHETETVKMVDKKDSEKRQFNWGVIKAASTVLVVGLFFAASALGGDFNLRLPKKQ